MLRQEVGTLMTTQTPPPAPDPGWSGMRRVIRKLAHKLGWTTSYHVYATYTRDSHIGFTALSMTCSIRPWLHRDNYRELMDLVSVESPQASSTPSITSITKLGL